MPLGREVGLGASDILLDGDLTPPPQKGAESPNLWPMPIVAKRLYGWINMALGMEVGLGPGHIVLDGTQLPRPTKGHSPLNFRYISIVAKRLDTSRCHVIEVGLGPGHIVLAWDLALPPQKKEAEPPNFRSMSIVAKRLDASVCHFNIGTEVGIDQNDIVLDSPPPKKRGHGLQFSAHVYYGQTVAHLSYC